MGFLLLVVLSTTAAAGEWSGYLGIEWRYFDNTPVDARQRGNSLSLVAQPEYYHEWNGGRDSFTFVPFLRMDSRDTERSHVDIRELTWLSARDDWELRIGIRKVFWGVTESQHLVDIINQTDLVENPDGEDKLGQPMINLAWIRDWGTLDLFILPGFRERSFPGTRGRLRTLPRVATELAEYQSSRGRDHVDAALRWSQSIGDWDIGLYHFYGTSRDPRLLPMLDESGAPVLQPFYDLIHQTGLDAQMTKGNWLWKLETIHRSGQGPAYLAATAGFEHTFYGIFGSAADLGVVVEYLYDERGENALTPFQDDVLAGLRFTFNDTQSTEALLGVVFDPDSGSRVYSLEAGRRLGEDWKLELEARIYTGIDARELLSPLRRDDYLQIGLNWHF